MFKQLLVICLGIFTFGNAHSSAGLVIHAAEFTVGKFHRYDNKVHNYGNSQWKPFILDENMEVAPATVRKNEDGSFSIFYSSLEEMIKSSLQLSRTEQKKISVLNIHGHGMPGAMWFPVDNETLNSDRCSDWVDASQSDDSESYDQYYSTISYSQIDQMRKVSKLADPTLFAGCVTGLTGWQSIVSKYKEFTTIFNSDAQIHFLSCLVGLGKAGDVFVNGIAQLLLANGTGRVEASMNFGLGDWSMTKGMGFWDYINDAQLKQYNEIYPKNRKDSEVAQKGTIKIARFNTGNWQAGILENQDFMQLQFNSVDYVSFKPSLDLMEVIDMEALPLKIQIPGTNAYVQRQP